MVGFFVFKEERRFMSEVCQVYPTVLARQRPVALSCDKILRQRKPCKNYNQPKLHYSRVSTRESKQYHKKWNRVLMVHTGCLVV